MESLIGKHYSGLNANNYDSRSTNKKWQFEQRIVENFIMNNSDIKTIIDAPLGTNRFSDVFERADHINVVYGYEYSDDMIAQAKKKISSKLNIKKWDLIKAPIKKKADLSLIIRMLNLFPQEHSLSILNNVLTATKKYCILTLRCWDKDPVLEQNKIYVQNENIFMNFISEAGFKVIKSQSIDTKVSGTYKVITVSR